jgi:hypothetical protein
VSTSLILSSVAAVSITLRRPGVSTRNDEGRSVQSFTDSTITASVQSGGTSKGLQHNAEGERQTQRRRIITESEIRAANQAAGLLADRVIIDGLTYEVQSVKRVSALLPCYMADVTVLQEEAA